jgi:hypothetical protein
MPENTEGQTTQGLDEQLETLLEPMQAAIISSLQEYVTSLVTPLQQRLDTLAKPQETSKPEETPLEARLKLLETELSQAKEKETLREAEASSSRFDKLLSDTLDGQQGLLYKSEVAELLAARIKSKAVEKDGQWLTKDGKTLQETVSEFFQSASGKHFLPANHQDGTGTPQPSGSRTTPTVSLDQQLSELF